MFLFFFRKYEEFGWESPGNKGILQGNVGAQGVLPLRSPTRQQSGLESAKGRAQVHRAGKVCPRIGVLGGLAKTEGRRRMTTEIGN